MTKHKAKERAKIMMEYVNGAKVQFFSEVNNEWRDVSDPNFNHSDTYRIKPKKTLKPLDYSDDLCGKVVISKENGTKRLVTGQRNNDLSLGYVSYFVFDYEYLYKNYVFADGSPCAKEIEK